MLFIILIVCISEFESMIESYLSGTEINFALFSNCAGKYFMHVTRDFQQKQHTRYSFLCGKEYRLPSRFC